MNVNLQYGISATRGIHYYFIDPIVQLSLHISLLYTKVMFFAFA